MEFPGILKKGLIQKVDGNWAVLENQTDGFLKRPLEFLAFLLYPWKFQAKQSFTPRSSTKLLHFSEILRPKTKTPENST